MKKVEINLCGNPTIFADGEKVNFPYKKVEGFVYQKNGHQGGGYLSSLGR